MKHVITIFNTVHFRREIQHWLSPSNVSDDLQKHAEDCMPGSCDWLLASSNLQHFQSSVTPALGRIQGRPGAGKSTAAGFFIRHLQSDRGTTVGYFFCNASESEKRLPVHVLRTVLSQLLRADERLYPIINDIYTQSGRTIADSQSEIEAALVAALANVGDARIVIVIDALDECQGGPKVLYSIQKCIRSAQSTARVLITSRPMALDVVPDYEISIDDVQSTRTHIKAYITQKVNANNHLRGSSLGNRVVYEVSGAADGLWLYARLMMDEIARLASSALVERQLQTIPRGLTQLYTQILMSFEQSFSPEQTRFAQQIFLWLDIDDYLPGFLLIEYEGLSYKTLSHVFQYVNGGQPVFNPIALAREICSPLVMVHEIPSTNRATATARDFELGYVHHTAEQYILESFARPLTDLPLVLQPRRLRYFYRAAVAMWYFLECSESAEYLYLVRADPYSHGWSQTYFDMSYGIWGVLTLSKFDVELFPEEIPELTSIIRKLCNFITSTKCLGWVETAIIVNYSAGYFHLLQNAIKAMEATLCAELNTIPLWREYQEARLGFLSAYVYLLGRTGPQLPYAVNYKHFKPPSFDSDPLACEILKICNKWQRKS
jgi:hypothetical protein